MLAEELQPALVLAPQGLGSHVDHRQTIRSVLDVMPAAHVAWYRDTPYAIRAPDAVPDTALRPLPPVTVPLHDTQLDRKIAAACAYGSQIGFQFGGADAAGEALRHFAAAEGDGRIAERFVGVLPPGFLMSPEISHSPAII